jgi:hypothetical protein
MHLVVSIVSVSTALVLDKGKAEERSARKDSCELEQVFCRYVQATGCSARSGDIATDKTAIVLELEGKITSAGTVAKASHVQGGAGASRHDDLRTEKRRIISILVIQPQTEITRFTRLGVEM